MTDTVDKIVIQSETQGVQQSTNDVQGLTKAMDGVTVASQNVEKSTGSIDSKFAALERRFSTTAGQATQLARVQKSVNDAVAANPALQDRANEVLAAATARYGTAVAAEKALTDAHVGLSAQGQAALHSVRSVVEQLALGIPPTQALTGQINHLSFAATGQGGLSGAFSEAAGTFTRFVTPMRLVAVGAAGVAAAALYMGNNWKESEAQIDRALTGIGARTGETLQSINKFSSDNASATGLSVSQARNIAIEFTKTGNIAVSGLKGVGDAIHGYAILTGKDATEATKDFASALSGDLVKGAEKINETYGTLNSGSLEYIRTLQLSGDRAAAIQVIIDSMSTANLRAADSVSMLSKAWTGFKNVASNIFNGVPSSTSDTDKLAQLQKQRSDVASSPSLVGQNAGGFGLLNTGALAGGKAGQLSEIDKQIDDLQKKIDAFSSDAIVKKLNAISIAGDEVVKAIIPQIEQIQNLEAALNKVQNAQNTPGVSRSLGSDDAAATAIQNQLAALRSSQGEAARYNQRVAEISKSWGDVGQSTALALQAAQNQLPVLEAVGGGAKIAAQAAADYKNYIDQGKTATEALALAAMNQASAMAQVNSAAKEQLAALQDQAAVAGARTPLEAASAQAQATFNSLIRQGVDTQLAMNIAAQQESNARAQIYEQMQKSVKASKDQLDLTRAQGTESEKFVKSRIAYENAIDAGATSDQASAISANVLATETIKAARAAEQFADQSQRAAEAWENAARAASKGSFDFSPDPSLTTKTGTTAYALAPWTMDTLRKLLGANASTDVVANAASSGSIDAALSTLKGASPALDVNTVVPGGLGGLLLQGTTYADLGIKGGGSTAQDIASAVSQLYDLKISAAQDNTSKAAATNDEIAYLKGQPQTLQTLSKIASLQQSIDQLKTSTDSLTATNQDLLSPYYSQDPRTSHIGFRTQGMASTGYVDIPGVPSANDNMTLTLPVASGERVGVWNGPNRGNSSPQINMGGIHITVMNGGGGGKVDTNAIGRTVFQAGQSMVRQLKASSQ